MGRENSGYPATKFDSLNISVQNGIKNVVVESVNCFLRAFFPVFEGRNGPKCPSLAGIGSDTVEVSYVRRGGIGYVGRTFPPNAIPRKPR
jgi:hypothetical protein